MPDITITLEDRHMLMLQWAATERKTTVDGLIAETVSAFLRPLEERYLTAHKGEVGNLFAQLSPQQQAAIITQIREQLEQS